MRTCSVGATGFVRRSRGIDVLLFSSQPTARGTVHSMRSESGHRSRGQCSYHSKLSEILFRAYIDARPPLYGVVANNSQQTWNHIFSRWLHYSAQYFESISSASLQSDTAVIYHVGGVTEHRRDIELLHQTCNPPCPSYLPDRLYKPGA